MTKALIIGGAGTGKTTELLRLMQKVIETGEVDPFEIGFCTFTRAARIEALQRAANKFNIDPEDLDRGGWFKTLHSICYRAVGESGGASKGSMVTDNKESREWIENAIQEEITNPHSDNSQDDAFKPRTAADTALALWDATRNRLGTIEEAWEIANYCDERTPPLNHCKSIIEAYEYNKRLDGRIDYTDLLAKFAGYKFHAGLPGEHRSGSVERTDPEGEVPAVPVWFLDEAQDNSALSDAVARRLVERAKWTYVVGDPFQSIYSWAGAHPKHFQAWEYAKREILTQTYRCPAPVLSLGEDILKNCSDYWDRGMNPAEHEGEVAYEDWGAAWWEDIDLSKKDTWLLLARSNFQANRFVKRLEANAIPWLPSNPEKGVKSPWAAPVRASAIRGLLSLEDGGVISALEWRNFLKQTKASTHNNKPLFVRGTKTQWSKRESGFEELADLNKVQQEWGATEDMTRMIRNRAWHKLIPHATDWVVAFKRFGQEAVLNPAVRIGTVHSVKGAEADNVVLLTTTSHQVHRSQEYRDGEDEERRVEYVAVTRARKRLIVCREKRAQYEMEGLK